jgi:hypothetical protein
MSQPTHIGHVTHMNQLRFSQVSLQTQGKFKTKDDTSQVSHMVWSSPTPVTINFIFFSSFLLNIVVKSSFYLYFQNKRNSSLFKIVDSEPLAFSLENSL